MSPRNLFKNAIHMIKRTRGARPKNYDNLITKDYMEGDYPQITRTVFRCFNRLLKEYQDDEKRHLIKSGGHEYDDFIEVFNWA